MRMRWTQELAGSSSSSTGRHKRGRGIKSGACVCSRQPTTMQRTQGRARNARIEVFVEEYLSNCLGTQRVQLSDKATAVCTRGVFDSLDFEETTSGSYAIMSCGYSEIKVLMDKIFEIGMYDDGGEYATVFRDRDGEVIMTWTLAGFDCRPADDAQCRDKWTTMRSKYGAIQSIRA